MHQSAKVTWLRCMPGACGEYSTLVQVSRHQRLLDTCSAAANESAARQERPGIAAPLGFEGHPQPQGLAQAQLRSESPRTAQHASSAGSTAASGHALAPAQQAARASMPAPPEEAAARQVHGSSAAKAKLQQCLAASEEVRLLVDQSVWYHSHVVGSLHSNHI